MNFPEQKLRKFVANRPALQEMLKILERRKIIKIRN